MQSPKHIYKAFRNRNKAIGKERRRNLVKMTLENQPHFPKTVGYEDIDRAVVDWVENGIDLVYDGKRLPTYKLFSNQRISEYGQNWKEVDEKGNIQTNFKTVSREINPQHGENQGNNYNIPGNRKYPIFDTYTVDEDGTEIRQIYTMKQPFAVNLIYTITIITSSYTMLNKMNVKMMDEFKGLEKYIFPNGFAMPIILNSVSDESDYTIDDRKYYSQNYQVKVLAFIINQEDYEVKKVPSRYSGTFTTGENSSKKQPKKKFDIGSFTNDGFNLVTYKESDGCQEKYSLENEEVEVEFEDMYNHTSGYTKIEIEDYSGEQVCFEGTEYEEYVNKKVVINVTLDPCASSCEFTVEDNIDLETIEITNVKEYTIYINGIHILLEDSDVSFNSGDVVKIEYKIKDEMKPALIKLVCYDPSSVVENTGNSDDNSEEITI